MHISNLLNPGSKYDNALRLGIKILDENEFKTMIESHALSGSTFKVPG